MDKKLSRLVSIAMLLPSAALADVTLKVVVIPNAPAPGTALQFSSNDLDNYPTIDAAGNVSFVATLSDGTEGVWSGPAGGISLVALGGGPVPTVPADNFRSDAHFFTDAEQAGPLMYAGQYLDGGNQILGAWLSTPGGPQQLIAQGGMTAPGTGGAIFSGAPTSVAVNISGQYTFEGGLIAGGPINANNQLGIWTNAGSGLQLSAQQGSQVPGMAAGIDWSSFGHPVMAAGGGSVFFAGLSNSQNGIFKVVSGTVTTLAISGVSGIGNLGANQPHTNLTGSTVFWADNGIWLNISGGNHKVAAAGSAVTGGGTLTTVFDDQYVSDDNRVFFLGSTGSGTGLYQTTPAGVVSKIAVPNQQAPGRPAGWVFSAISNPTVNSLGEVAFQANVMDPSNNVEVNDLFATDTLGHLLLVAGKGTQVQISPTLTETIAQTTLYPFTDVERTQFNANGQIAFFATFTDGGSAILVATLPEPGSLALLGAGVMALAARGRRRRGNR